MPNGEKIDSSTNGAGKTKKKKKKQNNKTEPLSYTTHSKWIKTIKSDTIKLLE